MVLSKFILYSAGAAVTISCVASAAAYYYKSHNKEIDLVITSSKSILLFLEAAKTSVSVCMPSVNNPAIQQRLVNLIKESVTVRIIIDSGYTEFTDFLLNELIEAGAEIKCRVKEPHDNQHKFCLIDDKILMTGTLISSDNWIVYVTNKLHLVDLVKREFHQMWSAAIAFDKAYEPSLSDTYQIPLITLTEATPWSV